MRAQHPSLPEAPHPADQDRDIDHLDDLDDLHDLDDLDDLDDVELVDAAPLSDRPHAPRSPDLHDTFELRRLAFVLKLRKLARPVSLDVLREARHALLP